MSKTIHEVMRDVMDGVGAVGKDSTNKNQGFQFRSIDAVVNACSPEFRKHGIVVYPRVLEHHYSTVASSSGRAMGHVLVKVEYVFLGPAGDSISAIVVGESMDSGDKATTKAMSVAYRTALLQSLCLPTNEIDPDAQNYERDRIDRHAEPDLPEPPRPVATEKQVSDWESAISTAANFVSLKTIADEIGAYHVDTDTQSRLRNMWSAKKEEVENAGH